MSADVAQQPPPPRSPPRMADSRSDSLTDQQSSGSSLRLEHHVKHSPGSNNNNNNNSNNNSSNSNNNRSNNSSNNNNNGSSYLTKRSRRRSECTENGSIGYGSSAPLESETSYSSHPGYPSKSPQAKSPCGGEVQAAQQAHQPRRYHGHQGQQTSAGSPSSASQSSSSTPSSAAYVDVSSSARLGGRALSTHVAAGPPTAAAGHQQRQTTSSGGTGGCTRRPRNALINSRMHQPASSVGPSTSSWNGGSVASSEFDAAYVVDSEQGRSYHKGQLLGKGGFARVYLITDITSRKQYACKIIPKHQMQKIHMQKVAREIMIHKELNHVNVVQMHHYFEDSLNVYMLLEACPKKLQEDMENYLMYTLMGGNRKLKSNVMPHIFECQGRPTTDLQNLNRNAAIKLNRKRTIDEILKEDRVKESEKKRCTQRSVLLNVQNIVDEVPSTSYAVPEMNNEIGNEYVQDVAIIEEQGSHEVGGQSTEREETCSGVNDGSDIVQKDVTRFGIEDPNMNNKRLILNKENKSISKTRRKEKHFRSKGTLAKPDLVTASCQTEIVMVDRKLSPITIPSESSSITSKSKSSSAVISSTTDYEIASDEQKQMDEEEDLEMTRAALKLINYFISIDTKGYIGIPNEWIWILEEISKFTKIPVLHIKLVLVKIKKNDTFQRISHSFGMSIAGARNIFHKSVHKIAHTLKTLIYCPTKLTLKKALPIPFRSNFSNVIGIIDCFEIQIEKPSHAVHQALTWSEYKKCNTLKYLLCISPDGFIIFISSGYGGRVSDTVLFQDCGIMEILPENSLLMADRGFKQIQTILDNKNIKLVRPPSVISGKKSSKEEVVLTKRIASLRIHVERVIRRIREFSLLQPHSTIDRQAISYIDSAVAIAAALINLQKPIVNS